MGIGKVAIVGAGHGGVQAAASLREKGFDGEITIYCGEDEFPYQRPPLSKAYLKDKADDAILPLRAAQFFSDKRINLMLGDKVCRIDPARRELETARGAIANYDSLILATGAKARPLEVEGANSNAVHVLRNLRDARRLRHELVRGHRLVIVGAGFIGLEIAASARALGMDVSIVEIGPGPLGRVVSPMTSDFFRQAHEILGAKFHFNAGVRRICLDSSDHVTGVMLADDTHLPADAVVLGVGVLACDDLALKAGLNCNNGIVVNAVMETSDPAILAIGDCAVFPTPILPFPIRLESVQNATDQARCAAGRIMGESVGYSALPWFWSDQADLKLQIAGLSHNVDSWVVRGDPRERSFAVFGFRGPDLAVVETVNRGADHMASRKILAAQAKLTPEQAGDLKFDLRKLASESAK